MLHEVECGNNIGNLHARVINVVLDLNGFASRSHHTHKSIAQHGVSQVSNMCGLVWIYVGMLDDNFPAARERRAASIQKVFRKLKAINLDIDVAVTRNLQGGNPLDGANIADYLGGDLDRKSTR